METSLTEDRLSRISTNWSLVLQAHRGGVEGDANALEQMIHHYHGAVYRYLLGAVRNDDVADELFQEFALRFARGGFRNVDPGQGRFRNYLRTVLIHLIHDHGREQQRLMESLSRDYPEPFAYSANDLDLEENFFASWREELLGQAWRRLAEWEREGQPYHTVLQLRAENPDWRSAEIAAHVNEQRQPAQPFSADGIRKLLQRAREQFSDGLIDEVGHSLAATDLSRIEEELIDLDLLSYCRSALNRRRSEPRP